MNFKSFESFINEDTAVFNIPYEKFDELTNEMLKYAKKIFNSKGFNAYAAGKSSATIEWCWFKGNPHDKHQGSNPAFSLSGWHGSGTYGYGKMITAIYVSNVPGIAKSYKPIIEWRYPFDNSPISNRMSTRYTTESFEDYKKFLIEVKKSIDDAPNL